MESDQIIERIKKIGEEGYKYLGFTKLEKINERKMKETFQKEYLRRGGLVLQSKLNGRNKMKAINTWTVSLMSYVG